jgi:SAM-dependent methyltransferase
LYQRKNWNLDQHFNIKLLIKFILNTIPRGLLLKASYWIRPLLVLWYKGHRYTDPIDGKSYRKFLPYGYAVKRENALAPGTLSLERHRLMWLYLKAETDFFSKNLKVLHIAPEQAFLKLFKRQKNLEYITADLFSPLADVKADITDLPFPNESFDVIFCNHVLEHIPDDTQAMSELFRVMKKGGWGIFQIPQDLSLDKTYEDFTITDPKDRAIHFGQYDHVRVYGQDYTSRLQSVGFEVEMIDFSHKISTEAFERYCLSKGELLPVCHKK